MQQETGRILRETGRHGERVVGMLEAAAERLEQGGLHSGEIACYCCREAFTSILRLAKVEAPSIRKAVTAVLNAANQDPDGSAGTPLAVALAELERVIAVDGERNQRLLSAVISDRSGVKPVRFQADLYTRASDLIRSLGSGLHSSASPTEASRLYDEALQIVEALFEPITGRISKVDDLVARQVISTEDVDNLESLLADPRVAEYFFKEVTGPAWFSVLRDHELVLPGSQSAFWPAANYLARLAANEPALVTEWMDEKLRDQAASEAGALGFVWMARQIGFPARQVVLTAVQKKASLTVAQEAATYVDSLDDEALGDVVVLRIVDASLKIMRDQDE